ncbi:MAG: hypothetical protein ACOC44_13880 [Promethearchaeia archaeon]
MGYLDQDILFFFGASLLIIGFVLMFLAVYDFPPIYEFEFQDSLLKLFIINENNNLCLYNCQFKEPSRGESEKEKELDKVFSGGIIGIDGIVSAITDTRDQKLNKIRLGDIFILLEKSGDSVKRPLIYALVVKKDLNSTHYALNEIKNQFENFYGEILNSDLEMIGSGKTQLFGSFDVIIKNIFKQSGGETNDFL